MENKKYCFALSDSSLFLQGTSTIEGTLKSAFDIAREKNFEDGELRVMIGELEDSNSNKVIKIKEFKLNRKGKMIL